MKNAFFSLLTGCHQRVNKVTNLFNWALRNAARAPNFLVYEPEALPKKLSCHNVVAMLFNVTV